jgi:hypothetical protein
MRAAEAGPALHLPATTLRVPRRAGAPGHERAAGAALHAPRPLSTAQPARRRVRAAAGADAQAFEALLAAPGHPAATGASPSNRGGAAASQPASAAAAGATISSPSASIDEGDALLPPILPLHRGAERFAWEAPDGALLEVIYRRGVAAPSAACGSGADGSMNGSSMGGELGGEEEGAAGDACSER